MKHQLDRRTILRAAVGGVGALCLPHAAVVSQPSAAAALEITSLGDALFVVRGAGCNVVVAQGSGGAAAMVDGGLKERSADLLSLVRNELSVSRIDTLFNSCWHPDRTGANEALGAAGARIMAHENTRLWLGRDVTRPWDDRTIKRLPPEACPNATFYEPGTVEVSGREVRYGYLLQAHTDGDIYVRFPAENVLVTGAAISASTWPLLDWWTGGWIGGLVDAFDLLLEVADENTRVVPGDGGAVDASRPRRAAPDVPDDLRPAGQAVFRRPGARRHARGRADQRVRRPVRGLRTFLEIGFSRVRPALWARRVIVSR